MISKALEEYLKTMYILQVQNKEIRVTDIANQMNLSKPSVNKAINNLKDVILDETLNVMKRETEECKKEAKEGYEYLKTLFESL